MEERGSRMGIIVLSNLIEKILKEKVYFNGNDLVMSISSKESLLKVVYCLKKHTEFQFTQLIDLYGIDYPLKKERFELQYVLWSHLFNIRLRIKVRVEGDQGIDSLTTLYPSANWLERECWDMFGIFFLNHPDLRRILTDYGFDGFPLRKDFPVSGFVEVHYNEDQNKIVYEGVELTQEYRLFHFLSPWEKK